MPRTRLLLLDDHVLFRDSLGRLLESEPDFEIAALCGTPAEALHALANSHVDLILLDFDLGEETAARFISAVSANGYKGKILMVTAGMSPLDSSLAWQMGISGILLKHSSPARLLTAIRTVAGGQMWIDDNASPPASASPGRVALLRDGTRLTPREQQVLRSVLEGLSNKEIAFQLNVSQSSVKATLQQLFDKTGVRTRSQLVRIAIEQSLEAPRS